MGQIERGEKAVCMFVKFCFLTRPAYIEVLIVLPPVDFLVTACRGSPSSCAEKLVVCSLILLYINFHIASTLAFTAFMKSLPKLQTSKFLLVRDFS